MPTKLRQASGSGFDMSSLFMKVYSLHKRGGLRCADGQKQGCAV